MLHQEVQKDGKSPKREEKELEGKVWILRHSN
jgi:hypothetical protein